MKLKLTTERKQIDIQILPLSKKEFKNIRKNGLRHTGFENKKFQMFLQGDFFYYSLTDINTNEDWRELGFKMVKKLRSIDVKSALIQVPESCDDFLEGMLLADYSFTKYKSKPTKQKKLRIILKGQDISEDELNIKINRAVSRVSAQFLVRDWVNTTPEDAHSGTIDEAVRNLFKESDNIEVEVYDERDLSRLNMNGHLAVNKASIRGAKTIKLTYSPEHTYINHHVFVGKGLTYDSGGLSIKPGNHMTDMKSDKAGAMTLWGLMKYLSEQGCPHKVTCYLALAENMIDGSAYKPDDIITMKNGKTVHIKNTDAEGRVVLFDNLTLAEEECGDASSIHSLATLTGAAVYQFGNEACGLVGFNKKLKKSVKKAGKRAGEIFMDAEFHRYMMDGVDDTLADLSNTGTANQGCQKAGLFLTNALKDKKKYLHWDIAGPAFASSAWGTNPTGGTGFGVRTLIEFLEGKEGYGFYAKKDKKQKEQEKLEDL